ncbi:MAG: CDP-alcohol phosphatidyltransferase family protein [Deltaproteobacteria bacterium]|nr:CDP-alcohol phosphatidyltransferase family protein [Deltaproteobacteria bacterium]
MFSFLCSILAAGLFALGGYPALLAGGLMAQFAMVIDCCDGAVARLKFQISQYGGWFDAVLDRYADAFLLFGLMWHAYAVKTEGCGQIRQSHARPYQAQQGIPCGPRAKSLSYILGRNI